MNRLSRQLMLAGIAVVITCGTASPQLGGGLLGGGLGSRLEHLRNRMTDKDPSIKYDPSVLRPGTPRSQVLQLMGAPNGTQTVNGVEQDVYAFFPDGSKYVDPQITAGTIAAAVFTAGMSLAVKAAKNTIQQNQLTLYDVSYDANQNIESVRVIPPNFGSEPSPAASPAGGGQ
jgi:hypothetical protein